MKKINFVKFTLDLIMGIIFSLLFNKNVLGGLKFHEIAGLAVGFAVLVHIIFNLKWVKNVTLSIFSKKITFRTRIGYILNMLLLLDMALIIICGICISKILFPGLGLQNGFFNQRTHIAAAYIGLALIGIHLGLHWKWVMNVFKKIINVSQSIKILGYIARVAAVLVLAFGIYSMISTNYFSKTAQMFATGSAVSFQHDSNMSSDYHSQWSGQKDSGTSDAHQSQDNSGTSKNISQDKTGGNPHFANGGNGMGSVNVFSVIAEYLSIMGVFAVIIYYVEKLLLRGTVKA